MSELGVSERVSRGGPSGPRAPRDGRREGAQQECGGERQAGCLGELEMRATPESGDAEDHRLPRTPRGSARAAPLQDPCPPFENCQHPPSFLTRLGWAGPAPPPPIDVIVLSPFFHPSFHPSPGTKEDSQSNGTKEEFHSSRLSAGRAREQRMNET